MRYPSLLVLVLWLLCLGSLPGEPADSLVTASDLMQVKQLGAPAISPDGKRVVYTVRGIVTDPRMPGNPVYRTQLWLASIDGGTALRPLTTDTISASSPGWNPAGTHIAFIQTDHEGTRLAVLALADGAIHAVTPPLANATPPRWSPDGSRLLFTATVSRSEHRAALKKSNPTATTPPSPSAEPAPPPAVTTSDEHTKSDAKTPDPATPAKPIPNPDGTMAERRAWLAGNATAQNLVVINRLDFDGTGGLQPTPAITHVFTLATVPGAQPVDLTPGDLSFEEAVWTPDSKSIVCTGPADDAQHPDRVLRRQLFSLNADGTDLHALPAVGDCSASEPHPSPDGTTIAFTARRAKTPSDLSYGQTLVGLLTLADGKTKLLAEQFDRSVTRLRWSADGKFIYFTAATNGGLPLHRVPVAGGKVERITAPDTYICDYDLSAGDLAIVVAKATNPGELYRASLGGRSQRLLTAHNGDWLRDKKLATPERRKLKRPDGVEIDSWVVKPTYLENGFIYPLLVAIHGGPGSMRSPADPATWHEFQYFAARGYGIVFGNPRGSEGYGSSLQHASFQNWGPGPGGDVLAMADAVSGESWVDAKRQIIMGDGYGGYLTAWIISQDQRFKAAIAAGGIYDLANFFGDADRPWQFDGLPSQPDIRKLLDDQSPLTRVESIRTPLLIKHDDGNLHDSSIQSALLYRSLKALGSTFECVVYPHANHDLSRNGDPVQRIDRLVRFDEFFQRFIGAPAQPIPPPVLPPKNTPPSLAPTTPPSAPASK